MTGSGKVGRRLPGGTRAEGRDDYNNEGIPLIPAPPDIHGIAVLVLTGFALVLFTRDRIALETSSLFILIFLVLGFQLFPYERNGLSLRPADFFIGFGNEALVTICALMIVGKALETTGALQPVAAWVTVRV